MSYESYKEFDGIILDIIEEGDTSSADLDMNFSGLVMEE